MMTLGWKAFCRRLLKKAQVCRSGSAKCCRPHEKTLTLWFKWQAFPYCHSKTVSSKLDCLKSRLNPDRSCLAFSLETCTSSKTCAVEIIRALSPCSVLQSPCTVFAAAHIYMREEMNEWGIMCSAGRWGHTKASSGGGYQWGRHVAFQNYYFLYQSSLCSFLCCMNSYAIVLA